MGVEREVEKIELEGAQGDEQTTAQIVEFWNHHLPFMYSVGGEYAHLALRERFAHFGIQQWLRICAIEQTCRPFVIRDP